MKESEGKGVYVEVGVVVVGEVWLEKKRINLQGEVVRDIPVNWCKSKLLSFPSRGRLSSNFSASHFRLGEESLPNLSSCLGGGKASGT